MDTKDWILTGCLRIVSGLLFWVIKEGGGAILKRLDLMIKKLDDLCITKEQHETRITGLQKDVDDHEVRIRGLEKK